MYRGGRRRARACLWRRRKSIWSGPLRNIHGRACLPDTFRRQRLEVDAATINEEETRSHKVRAEVRANMNDMGRPHFFHTNNGGESTSRSFVNLCDSGGIHREFTAPGG